MGRPLALNMANIRVDTWDECILLVTTIDPAVAANMHTVEAPDRPLAFTQALRSLLDGVNRLRMEASNQLLGMIAPVIQEHGIDYERGKFKNKLDSGILTLEKTKVCVGLTTGL